MIPALERWKGDHAMTKNTTQEAAVPSRFVLEFDSGDLRRD